MGYYKGMKIEILPIISVYTYKVFNLTGLPYTVTGEYLGGLIPKDLLLADI